MSKLSTHSKCHYFLFRKPYIGGERGGSGYTLFNFRVSFATNVYHEVRDGRKVLIKEIAMKEEKASYLAV